MTAVPSSVRRAAALVAAGLLLAGCGLSEELDREMNPGRASDPVATPSAPSAATPSGANATAPSGTAPTGLGTPPVIAGPSGSVAGRPGERRPSATATGRCPRSGLTMSPGMVTAAMGLRAMSVTATNCGDRVRTVDGYPDIRVRGLDHELFAVTVLTGTEPVTTMDDPGPRRIALEPGQSAYTSLVWRYSAVDAGTRRGSGVYVEIGPGKGAPRRTVEPDGGLDIGETGMLGTTAWQRSPAS
ncbi:DUF4232 domain-containing protein [Streptomyces sp. NPDC047123]|uniref:DUF4232 domain-containing protein n=1 Tax=Streptomyces sp. NPDC047123 TaxID=3155622 RepID=UPI00340A3B26